MRLTECYARAPAEFPPAGCDAPMTPVWRGGRGGWGCERCRVIVGPLDVVFDGEAPDTPGRWRYWYELLPKGR